MSITFSTRTDFKNNLNSPGQVSSSAQGDSVCKPVAHLASAQGAAEFCRRLPFTECGADGVLDRLRLGAPAEISKHHSCRQHRSHGIGNILSCNVWCGAVDGFE